MDIENCVKCMPVFNEERERVRNLCFDGSFYYFLIEGQLKIIKTDVELHIICSYDSCLEYNCICFDWKEHCFWAVSNECSDTIYKLDCNMKEICSIKIQDSPESCDWVTGISFDCCADALVLSYNHTIVQVDKFTGKSESCFELGHGDITGILSLCPGYLIAVQAGNKQFIFTLSPDKCLAEILCQHSDDTIRNLIFHPTGQHCQCLSLDLLIIDSCGCACIKSITFSEGELNYDICKCNFEICHNSCKRTPPAPATCCDVIESIALVEASIAHILNAEGEKLQKVLQITDNIDTILKVNEVISETIIHVTGLEHELYSKLRVAYQLCVFQEQHPCQCVAPRECLCEKIAEPVCKEPQNCSCGTIQGPQCKAPEYCSCESIKSPRCKEPEYCSCEKNEQSSCSEPQYCTRRKSRVSVDMPRHIY